MKQAEYTCLKDCTRDAIVPIYEEETLCETISQKLEYDVTTLIDTAFQKVTIIHTLGKFLCKRIIFLGMGKKSEMTTKHMREAFSLLPKYAQAPMSLIAKRAVCGNIDVHKVAALFAESYELALYKETKLQSEEDCATGFDADIVANEDISGDIACGLSYAYGINHAKDLANTPANYMTPKRLSEEAKELAERYSLECDILDQEALKKLNAGGILAVNQGSDEEPYLIVLKYQGAGDHDPYTALVGKGLTFDAGGYNLKSDCNGMKYDMCGGADVLGAMEIIAANHFQKNVVALVPTTENLVNGKAYKPQDVIMTMSGLSVEVDNTDAEGRLILCDAITYAQKHLKNVTRIVDIATLTGACARALGNVYTGIFANDEAFYRELIQAMSESDEKGWRLPLDDAYAKCLESSSADLKNVGKGGGGASVAASFLERFIEQGIAWIHLDIAGVSNEPDSGATGTMVRTLANLCK